MKFLVDAQLYGQLITQSDPLRFALGIAPPVSALAVLVLITISNVEREFRKQLRGCVGARGEDDFSAHPHAFHGGCSNGTDIGGLMGGQAARLPILVVLVRADGGASSLA